MRYEPLVLRKVNINVGLFCAFMKKFMNENIGRTKRKSADYGKV